MAKDTLSECSKKVDDYRKKYKKACKRNSKKCTDEIRNFLETLRIQQEAKEQNIVAKAPVEEKKEVKKAIKKLLDTTKPKKGPKKHRQSEQKALGKCAVKFAAELKKCNDLLKKSNDVADVKRSKFEGTGNCFQEAIVKNWECQDTLHKRKSKYFAQAQQKTKQDAIDK